MLINIVVDTYLRSQTSLVVGRPIPQVPDIHNRALWKQAETDHIARNVNETKAAKRQGILTVVISYRARLL
jgi:hypothetical protein